MLIIIKPLGASFQRFSGIPPCSRYISIQYTVAFAIRQRRFLSWPTPAHLFQGRELGKNFFLPTAA